MYAYRVRPDCLKWAVLCFPVGRWEFERSTRHFMEFEITKDNIAQWNKMLLFLNKIKKVYSPCLIGLFCRFLGVFMCLSQLSTDEVKAGHCCFERPGPRGPFTRRNSNLLLDFPLQRKEGPLLRSAYETGAQSGERGCILMDIFDCAPVW